MHNIVTSSEKFSFGHVEVVFVLHVTVAEQAAAHQRIDVGGKAKRADFVDVEIRGKIVVIVVIFLKVLMIDVCIKNIVTNEIKFNKSGNFF